MSAKERQPDAAGYDSLSPRLRAAYALITPGSRLADIGCDHAYLPIALCRDAKIPGAIAADIRQGPLAIAKQHIAKAGLQEQIQTRISDGLSEIRAEEVDSISVLGMGGQLLCSILRNCPFPVSDVSEWILGPQRDFVFVRQTVYRLGLSIAAERMIRDGTLFYPILRCVPKKNAIMPDDMQLLCGPCLLQHRDPVLHKWILHRLRTLEAVREEIRADEKTSLTAGRASRLTTLQKEEQLLRAAMTKYEM